MCGHFFSLNVTTLFLHPPPPMSGPTCICEGLDVKRQVYVHTLCILHLLKDDPDKPHGYKVVPAAETHKKQRSVSRTCLDALRKQFVLWVTLDSLVAVLFGPWEGLGVDMSQGDVLVPLQVPHQNTNL